jgi:hypothetical protein
LGLFSVQRVITGRAQSFYSGALAYDDPVHFGDVLRIALSSMKSILPL